MPAVEPRRLDRADEKLAPVRVRAAVRHGEIPGAGVLEAEVFIREFGAVDGLAAASVAVGEVAALDLDVGSFERK